MRQNQKIENNSVPSEVTNLLETVIDGGYCIGYGACASISRSSSPLKMQLDESDKFKATIDPLVDQSFLRDSVESVCPFSKESLNEDEISQPLFSNDCQYHDKIGYNLATYAGYVLEGDFRDRGSSGGMGTWLVSNLLSQSRTGRWCDSCSSTPSHSVRS